METVLRVEKNLGQIPLASAIIAKAEILSLPYGERSKSRFRAAAKSGLVLAIFMERGSILRDGDILEAEDGRHIRIIAMPQIVLEAKTSSSFDMVRAAYHLGNRHTPVQIGKDFLRLEEDPVLADMLRHLGLRVETASLPFEPEAGAYAGGHHHGHEATFEEDYALAQAAYHHHDGHSHSHAHPHTQKKS